MAKKTKTEGDSRARRAAARRCPTPRASTCSRDEAARRSTSARRARSASGSPRTSPARRTRAAGRAGSSVIEILVTADRGRGAARRAELHQAPPAALQHPAARRQVLSLRRHQPRRGVPARLLHPRAPPRRTAPTSAPSRRRSGCGRRSTCSASCSSTGPARAPSRAGARACPASTTTSSAARRPASATSTARSTGATSTAIVDFLSGRYRQVDERAGGEDGRGRRRRRTSSGRPSSATA